MSKFKNTAVKKEPRGPNYYGFDKVPNLLFVWSRLFQSTISQAGTYLLTQKFHTGGCAIYKTEGGCTINGGGDLVLGDDHCYWDYGSVKNLDKMAGLITAVVLEWDPNRPIDSMLERAGEYIKVDPQVLKEAIQKSSNGGAFGGDALTDFFNWNPFSPAPIDEKYEKWCSINISGESEESVNQRYADQKLGSELLKKLVDKARSSNNHLYPLCCSPRRFKDDGSLHFWINTGRSTNIDGWKTEADILTFLKGDGKIVDRM